MFKIRHPEIEATGEASEEAFKQVWEPRGWERVDDAVVAAMDFLGVNVRSLDQLTKQQLMELAASQGRTIDPKMTKEELLDVASGVTATPMGVATNEPLPDEAYGVDEEEDLASMTKEELVNLAQSRGITGATMSKSKPDLIEMIESGS